VKGEKFMKIIVAALLCVAAAYLIFSVTRFSGDAFTTYKAVRYEVGDGITTSGFLVRSEQAVQAGDSGIIVPTRSEGEKVGKGQNVAAVYRDESAKSRQLRIEALEGELEQMKRAYSFSSSDIESATLDTDILRLVNQITVSAARREYAAADKSAEALKPYILRRYLNSGDAEIPTSRIGDMVMNELRAVNDVAYVRFAAVYRKFTDLTTFMAELQKLVGESDAGAEAPKAEKKGE
jgi:hypothetical protein